MIWVFSAVTVEGIKTQLHEIWVLETGFAIVTPARRRIFLPSDQKSGGSPAAPVLSAPEGAAPICNPKWSYI